MVPSHMEPQNDTSRNPVHLPYSPEDPWDDGLTDTYQYTPITNSGGTRLLRLLPSTQPDAPIRCSLFHYSPPTNVSLGTDPYEALSYVWGNELHRRGILIDQYWFEVTLNLYDALASLRHPVLERVLWVDALCIDQQNNVEKGQQVASMASVYARANRVIVWLGSAASGSDEALEIISSAGSQESSDWSGDSRMTCVNSLLQRPWFERIWVLQEVAAARQVLIKCGATEMDGYAFCSGLNKLDLSGNGGDPQSIIGTTTYLIKTATFRPRGPTSCPAERLSLGIGPLIELVERYYNREATDRRDKLFALLGMSSDNWHGEGRRLVADYQSDWSTVFCRFLRAFLSPGLSVEPGSRGNTIAMWGKAQILGQIRPGGSQISKRGDALREAIVTWCGIKLNSRAQSSKWEVGIGGRAVLEGDAVCLLEGTFQPTILRFGGLGWFIVRPVVELPVPPSVKRIVVSQELSLFWGLGGHPIKEPDYSLVARHTGWRDYYMDAENLEGHWSTLQRLPTHDLLMDNLYKTAWSFEMALERTASRADALIPANRQDRAKIVESISRFATDMSFLTASCLAIAERRLTLLSVLLKLEFGALSGSWECPANLWWIAESYGCQRELRDAGGFKKRNFWHESDRDTFRDALRQAVNCGDIAMTVLILGAARKGSKRATSKFLQEDFLREMENLAAEGGHVAIECGIRNGPYFPRYYPQGNCYVSGP